MKRYAVALCLVLGACRMQGQADKKSAYDIAVEKCDGLLAKMAQWNNEHWENVVDVGCTPVLWGRSGAGLVRSFNGVFGEYEFRDGIYHVKPGPNGRCDIEGTIGDGKHPIFCDYPEVADPPRPLKCGPYQHLEVTRCSGEYLKCFGIPYDGRCVDDLHTVTENEWFDLQERLKRLEDVVGAGRPLGVTPKKSTEMWDGELFRHNEGRQFEAEILGKISLSYPSASDSHFIADCEYEANTYDGEMILCTWEPKKETK